MNPLLMALLGQQAAPEVVPQDEILVQASRSKSEPGSPVDGLSAPNDRAIEAVQADVKRGEEASQRRGMFGVKGTLRDVLGLVGDAFLVQGGRDPYYAPRRRQEQISDAMAGFTEDPVSASERTAYYDPKLGRELYNEYEDNLIKKAQAESLAAARKSKIEDDRAALIGKGRLAAQSLLARPAAYAPDGTLTPEAQQVLEVIARQHNTDTETLLGGLSGNAARLFSEAAIDPYKQNRLEQYDRGLDQGQQNADSRRISANASALRTSRPPAGRAPRAETDREVAIRIGDKPESQRTPGEQAFFEKYTSSGSKKRRPSGSTSGWTIRPAGK